MGTNQIRSIVHTQNILYKMNHSTKWRRIVDNYWVR